jgi:hypothetical protein
MKSSKKKKLITFKNHKEVKELLIQIIIKNLYLAFKIKIILKRLLLN